MHREIVNRIEVLGTGELFLGLEGEGASMYQYIYREAGGVYWDQTRRGFKSTPMKKWSCARWYKHMVSIVRSGLGMEIILSDQVFWINVPDKEKAEILREIAI